jgi:cyclopropane fatty-acyl-phospholipid synthase-like methyltransferase
MLEMADVGPLDVVYDLGSGDGRIPITAAKEFGARGVGIEIDPELVQRAQANARDAGVADSAELRLGDI